MANILEQLESDQAVLLMYLADELSRSDRAQVDHRLSSEEKLRAELAAITADYAAVTEAMDRMDVQTPVRISADAAAGRVGRMMRQWTTGRLARPVMIIEPKKMPLPWWCYPLVSAACIAIAVTVWSIYRNDYHLNDGFHDAIVRSGAPTDPDAHNGADAPPTDGLANATPSSPSSPTALPSSATADSQDDLLDATASTDPMASGDATDDSEGIAAAVPPSESIDNLYLDLGSEADIRGTTR